MTTSISQASAKGSNTGKDKETKGEELGNDDTITCCERCRRLGHAKTNGRKPEANISDGNRAAASGKMSSQASIAIVLLLFIVSLEDLEYGLLTWVLRIT